MSISESSEFKSIRKSHSLPHIFVKRHESGVSNATASTTISGHGSCSILDQMDLESVGCDDHQHHLHHHHRFNSNNPNVYHARNIHRHYNDNSGKYNKHNNNNYFRHQQCENVREKFDFNYTFIKCFYFIAFSLGNSLNMLCVRSSKFIKSLASIDGSVD